MESGREEMERKDRDECEKGRRIERLTGGEKNKKRVIIFMHARERAHVSFESSSLSRCQRLIVCYGSG